MCTQMAVRGQWNTPIEYSQLKREITHSRKKRLCHKSLGYVDPFHQYLYGRRLTLLTDTDLL